MEELQGYSDGEIGFVSYEGKEKWREREAVGDGRYLFIYLFFRPMPFGAYFSN